MKQGCMILYANINVFESARLEFHKMSSNGTDNFTMESIRYYILGMKQQGLLEWHIYRLYLIQQIQTQQTSYILFHF